MFWISVATIVACALGALVLTAPDDEERAIDEAADAVPAFADVSTSGRSLATWDGATTDAAEGQPVPELRGTTFDGTRVRLAPGDGVARVYVVVAHWCPHCREEVPRLARWAREHPSSEGVAFVTVSTAVSEDQPNFPPAAWLAREGWPWDVLVDDEVGTAAGALGVEGFPFLVFADRRGVVRRRFSGEMPIDEFDAEVASLVEPVERAGGIDASDGA